MRVCLATYPTAFQQQGGGERVLTSLGAALEPHVDEVALFDPWTTRLDEFDVLHYFSTYGAGLFPEWRRYVRTLAVTPFIWPELPTLVRATRRVRDAARTVLRRPLSRPFAEVDVLFPTSRTEADLLVRNYGADPERIVPVPHGADVRFAEPPSGAFADLVGISTYVLCPGRIDPNKNQLRLIRALADEDLDLVVLGNVAAGHEDYGRSCRAAAGPRTQFVEALPHESEELRDAVAGAACLVVASEYELCSVAALEGGIAGTPLASTSGGGMVEHLSPYASFFDPTSEDEIRSAVRSALAAGRRAGQREHFAERFSWDAVARATASAYERHHS